MKCTHLHRSVIDCDAKISKCTKCNFTFCLNIIENLFLNAVSIELVLLNMPKFSTNNDKRFTCGPKCCENGEKKRKRRDMHT